MIVAVGETYAPCFWICQKHNIPPTALAYPSTPGSPERSYCSCPTGSFGTPQQGSGESACGEQFAVSYGESNFVALCGANVNPLALDGNNTPADEAHVDDGGLYNGGRLHVLPQGMR